MLLLQHFNLLMRLHNLVNPESKKQRGHTITLNVKKNLYVNSYTLYSLYKSCNLQNTFI